MVEFGQGIKQRYCAPTEFGESKVGGNVVMIVLLAILSKTKSTCGQPREERTLKSRNTKLTLA